MTDADTCVGVGLTDANVPQVQVFKVSEKVYPSEMAVQRIRTIVTQVGDIQTITTNAASNLTEVQSISITALSNSLRGNFTLTYGFYETSLRQFNASANEVSHAL